VRDAAVSTRRAAEKIVVTIVEIYTSPFCPYCHRAKSLLEKKRVAFIEYDVFSEPGKRQEMLGRSGGRGTVPQIFVDGRHIGDSDELVRLERAGDLDVVLQGGG
jgi:glutaredoxin 3